MPLSPTMRPWQCPGNYFPPPLTFLRPPKSGTLYGASWYEVEEERNAAMCAHVVAEMDFDRKLHVVECQAVRGISEAVKYLWLINEGLFRQKLEITPKTRKLSSIQGVLSWFCCPHQTEKAAGVVLQDHERREITAWTKGERRDALKPYHPSLTPLDIKVDLAPSAARLHSFLSTGSFSLAWELRELARDVRNWPAVPHGGRIGALCVLAAGVADMVEPSKRRRVRREEQAGWIA